MLFRALIPTALLVVIGGCGSPGLRDSGPNRPFDPDSVAEIEPRIEPRSRNGNPPSYRTLGKTYRVLKSSAGFRQRGAASWYGSKFHGRKTSNGERYDMYAISAAHNTLPIPTYLRVTNLANGRSLIVRVNDRGPFHSNRIIDLSYAAAAKLGYADKGTTQVEIRAIDVAQYRREKRRSRPSHSPVQAAAIPLPQPVTPVESEATAQPMVAFADHAKQPQGVVANSSLTTNTEKEPQMSDVARRFYIQLGAFSSRINAEYMVNKMAQARIAKRGSTKIQAVPGNSTTIYRVRLGPFSNESAAARIVQQLIENNIGEPWIILDS